jgi:hypothetical protein
MIPPDPVAPVSTVTNIDNLLNNLAGIDRIVSFGEDAVGNLYIVDMATGPNNAPDANTGEVYRILTDNLLPGDYDADGNVDDDDFLAWRLAFGMSGAGLAADGNANGVVDAADYVIWRNNQGASVHASMAAGGVAIPEPITVLHLTQPLAILIIGRLRRNRSRQIRSA